MMTKLYLFSKSIHRILVLIIIVLGLVMASTGAILKYTFLAITFPFINLGLIRYIHNQLSPFFALVFLSMLVTGSFMYVFPFLRKK